MDTCQLAYPQPQSSIHMPSVFRFSSNASLHCLKPDYFSGAVFAGESLPHRHPVPPLSHNHSHDELHDQLHRKPLAPQLLHRNNSFTTDSLSSIFQFHFSPRNPLTLILFFVLVVHFVILCIPRSFPTSVNLHHHVRHHFPSPLAANSLIAAAAAKNGVSKNQPDEGSGDRDQCGSGTIFVYDLPRSFNREILENCDSLNPWSSRCDAFVNDGFGQRATGLAGIVPRDVSPAWYWTDQFVSEIIFHDRILNHKCRVTEPESATAFYIPSYAGLASEKYLWSNASTSDRDRHCKKVMKWVQDQPYYKKSNGWDHFITMGRITWDFRRSKDEDHYWGSSCINMPGMRNISRLLIERNPWDYFDIGVPYPTGFHPSANSEVTRWQSFVRTRNRNTLFCFAGAPRATFKDDFRGLLLSQCRRSSGSCRVVNCSGTRCRNGTSAILETFLDSEFCLQPRGDSFTRRSVFDCMVAGSIPVFFWKRTAYLQYEWFLPAEPGSYSVYIDRNEVRNGTSIKAVLEKYSEEEVRKMREKVTEYIPRIVYAKSHNGLEGMKDAFDVAMEGVLRRFKQQEQSGFSKWT